MATEGGVGEGGEACGGEDGEAGGGEDGEGSVFSPPKGLSPARGPT